MNKATIIHKSTIFDKRRFRLMSESRSIKFRAQEVSSTTKKNKPLSRYALKAEMKDILRYYARVDFDSDRDHQEKALEIA
jgi:predicted solute-binding protein